MTGIQPAALLDDPLLYAAAQEDAKAAAWTDLHELLALNAEVTHAVLRAVIHGSGGTPPEPFQVPRPDGRGAVEDEPVVMRPHEFASHLARGGG